MAKRLQHRGGTTAQHSTFTGAVREVTVDTTKNTLVVHDGATAGGHPLATATNFTSTGIDDNATSTAITIDSSENVGIGETVPLGKLHVKGGDSATTSADNLADELVVESSGTGGMTILTPASSSGNIFFGDPNSNTIGRVTYAHTSNAMVFTTNNSEAMRIDSSGRVGIGTSNPLQQVAISVNDSNTGIGNGRQNLELSNNNGTNNTYSRITFNDTAGGAASGILGVKLTDTANNYGQFEFYTRGSSGGGTRMVIDPNGNVGIGTSSPVSKLTVAGQITATSGGTSAPTYSFDVDTNTGISRPTNDTVNIVTNGSERMRISSSGNVVLGTTTTTNGQLRLHSGKDSTTDSNLLISNGAGSAVFASFTNFGVTTVFGSITKDGSGVAYNTTSDYRAKENVNYDFDATTRLKQLKPARFNFIADADTTVDGFLAHEVEDIVPEAIHGTKDAVDENGNPVYQGIDQSKLVPLLVKTIQELEARITALETQP